MGEEWVPFGYSKEDAADYYVLREELDDFVRPRLLKWIASNLPDQTRQLEHDLNRLQAQLRSDLLIGTVMRYGIESTFQSFDDVTLLRLIDGMLANSMLRYATAPSQLESIFTDSSSKWKPGLRQGQNGIVERVPEGVQTFTEGVISDATDSGKLLARAWSKVHGIEKDATGAYRDAVRAVETIAKAVVQPKKADATLGTVIGQIKADGDWTLPMKRPDPAYPTAQVVLGMLKTLWVGQHDRHASEDVELEEARIAVGLAASLIDWFDSGQIARRP